MDILTNKSKRFYDYTSRYATFPFYYNNEDRKYMYGITSNLKDDTEYIIHYIKDIDTLDTLSVKYYGRPDLYWVIADFNRIRDPYIHLSDYYNFIYVPELAGIRWDNGNY